MNIINMMNNINFNSIRIVLAIVILFCAFGSLFLFILSKNPLKKIINLAISYNCVIFFMIYNIFIQNKEGILLEFLIMTFISFLLNISIGISIINNIIKAQNDK